MSFHSPAKPELLLLSLLLGVGAGKHLALRGCRNKEHLGFGQFFLRIISGFLTFLISLLSRQYA